MTVLVLLVGAPSFSSVDVSVGGSPGAVHAPSVIADACPTFSWGTVAEAKAYELIVLRVTDRLGGATVRSGWSPLYDAEVPVQINVVIPAPASSWTPATPECLERGETYAWYVRAKGGYSQTDGNWSEGRMFEVDAWADASPGASTGAGYGTGGVPAVQRQLDAIQAQMAERRAILEATVTTTVGELATGLEESFDAKAALLVATADALDAHLGVLDSDPVLPSIAGRLQEIKGELFPCTNERFENGECEKNSPLDLKVMICGSMNANAALKLAYSAGVRTTFKGGARWDIGLLGGGEVSGDIPAVPIVVGLPPLPLPTIDLSGQGGANLAIKLCLVGIKVPLPGDLKTADRNELLAAMLGPVDGFISTANRIVGDLGLSPARLEDTLEGLEALQDAQTIIEDPLAFFEPGGPLRELADNLPVGDRAQEFLSHPERLVPRMPDSCEGAFPDGLGSDFDNAVDDVCSVVDTAGGGFLAAIDTIESGAGRIKTVVDGIPIPVCGNDICERPLELCFVCNSDCKCTGQSCNSNSDCWSGVCGPEVFGIRLCL